MGKSDPSVYCAAWDNSHSAWWGLHLLGLYTEFFVQEGKAPPKKIVPFVEDESLIRLIICPTTNKSIAVGMATVSVRNDGTGTCYIGMVEDVFVLPEHRGNGYSTMLVEMIIHHARLQGLIRLELTSAPHKPGRDIAMKVYEKLGFKLIATANPEAGKDATNFYRLKL